jgi:AraC-like DNA-binding protein
MDQRAATMIGPGMIRVSAAMPLPIVLRDFGVELEPVLSDLGVRHDIFSDFENAIVGDGAVAISFLILQALCGPRWSATEVFFSRRKPANLRPYKEFFKTSLRFDCDSWGISFPAAWLDHPVRRAEPVLRKPLVKDMPTFLAAAPDEFRDIVQRRMNETLSSGEFETEAVADFLGISQRKLHRRQEAEGASVRAILRDARYGAARQLMGRTGLPVSEIAVMVGYSETSAFVGAFKRWSGATLGSWRNRTASDRDSHASAIGMSA